MHRIQADYELGLVITTSRMPGGLSVCDIETNRVLWALPPVRPHRLVFSRAPLSDTVHLQSHVEMYTHIEYDRGYIVFARNDNHLYKEVWRHTIDADSNEQPEMSPPDKKMLDASKQAATRFSVAGSRRGQFKAWALLHVPEFCCWTRVSYPNLLAVAADKAYVWDISRSQLVSVIQDIQRRLRGFRLAGICYAEVSDLHVFICAASGLRIFAREGGALLYQLPSRELSGAIWDVRPHTPSRGSAMSVVDPQMLRRNNHPPSSLHDTFMACTHFCFESRSWEPRCFQVTYRHRGKTSLFLHQTADWSYCPVFSAYFPDPRLRL